LWMFMVRSQLRNWLHTRGEQQQSLCDASQQNVDVVGLELSLDGALVWSGLVVELLVAVVFTDGGHALHPEVIAVGADDVQRLAEGDFNIEPIPVEGDDLEGAQGGVGAQQPLWWAPIALHPPYELRDLAPNSKGLHAEYRSTHDPENPDADGNPGEFSTDDYPAKYYAQILLAVDIAAAPNYPYQGSIENWID